ncbi:MAG: hypothetical protein IT324_16780 [Anaerolineae bacterium]|nr:hypothetical protein [Anaerolineae bacterium]
MKTLRWVESGDGYVAKLQHGRVVITPTDPPNSHRPFTVRIETASGEVVSADSFDLAGCKAWVFANLTLMDRSSGEYGDFGNVFETLELCQHLLHKDTDASHWLRIEHIKQGVAEDSSQTYQIIDISLPNHPPSELNWVEDGTTFYADTPHGRAVIEEGRPQHMIDGIRHAASIVHHSGAVMPCHSWVDFMGADAAIKENLTKLDLPYIAEWLLDCLDFTLDFCQRILPEKTDPIHYVRLETLKMEMHLTLD